jgi:hypothetical protein
MLISISQVSTHQEPAQSRFQQALTRWIDKHAFICYQTALDGAEEALQRGDVEVAVLFCRYAGGLLAANAESMRRHDTARHNLTMNPTTIRKGVRPPGRSHS